MKLTILNPDDFTVKVVSINKKNLLEGTIKQLEGHEAYEDTVIDEDLYSCNVREDIPDYLNANVSKQLGEIEKLCATNDASYFRLVTL